MISFARSVKWVTGAILIFCLVATDSCMQFRMKSAELEKFYNEKGLQAENYTYQVGNRTIHYVKVGDENLPLVLFVHGSPGSLSSFKSFLADSTLLDRALLIAVDRPGFGFSDFGRAERSLAKQAALLKPILEKYKNNRPITLVGHSLGGPVIARMAMDYPELVDGLVMVAPSIDPDLEPNEWFRAPLATPFLKWLLPRSIRASNDEIYALKPELQKMLPLWSHINAKTIVIQGGKDTLVPPGNAYFAQKMITQAPVQLVINEQMNHFVPWTFPELIKDAVIQLTTFHAGQTQLSSH